MDFETEKKLRFSYNDNLFDLLKFNEFLADKKFIRRLATNKTKMLFGYLKDIRFYLKFIDECKKRYPSFDIENIRKNCIIVEDFSNEILYISIKDKYNIKTLEEIKYMHFDVAVMNPPYEGNLHLKILEQIIPIAEKVVNISPIRWLQDPLTNFKKNTDYKKYKKSIVDKIETLNVIPASDAMSIFKILISTDLGIYVIKAGGFDSENFRRQFYNHNLFEKSKEFWKFPSLKVYEETNKNYFVTIKTITNRLRTTAYNIASLHNGIFYKGKQIGTNNKWRDVLYKTKTCNDDRNVRGIYFKSLNEAQNFFNWTKLISVKYIVKQIVFDQHIHTEFLPYMSDYTKPWTDKRFCEYFGITGYISDTEAVPGSEWETILNSMKDFN